MASPAILKVDILADANKAIRALNDVGDTSDHTGGRLKGFGKVAGTALLGVGAAAVGAAAGAVAFGVSAVKAAEESAVATKRLDAVFSAMGETTGQASKAAQDYASALSRRIGVDDELIMAGQAQLATFGDVSSEVARTAGVFDRATSAAADLAAAGFGTIDSNAVQLGKALNDPIKGLAALSKSGVTFTDQQKEQIKVMQESGDLLGAQKVVLAAVEGQVKGTAEATATGGQKMAIAFGELQENIGAAILPIINVLMPLFAAAIDFLSVEIGGGIKAMVAAFKDGGDDITSSGIAGIFERIGVAARNMLPAIIDFGRRFIDTIRSIIPHVVTFAKALIGVVVPAVQKIVAAVMKAAPPIIDLFRDLATSALPKIQAVLTTVVPIVATFAEKVILLAGWLAKNRDVLVAIVIPIAALIITIKTIALVTQAWAAAQAILNAVMALNPIVLVVVAIAALVAAIWLAYNRVGWFHDAIDKLWKIIQVAFDAILKIVKGVFDWISDHWELLLIILTGPFGLAVVAIQKHWDTVVAAVGAVIDWIKDHWQLLLAILTGPIGLAVLAVKTHFQTIKDAATDVWKWVTDKFQAIADFISGLVSGIGHTVGRIVDAIKGPMNVLLRAWNRLEFTIPRVEIDLPGPLGSIGAGPWTVGLPDVPLLASGGMVARTGLAVVHAGEMFSGVGRSFSSGGNVNITVNTTGLGADAPSIQRAVANALRGYTARNGPLDIPVRGVA